MLVKLAAASAMAAAIVGPSRHFFNAGTSFGNLRGGAGMTATGASSTATCKAVLSIVK